jgi:hypothetical protein
MNAQWGQASAHDSLESCEIKKSVLTGIVSGITSAVTILILLWTYIYIEDWYKDYKRKLDTERIASTPPDKRSGDYCPMCKSKDVSRFIYGLRAANDSATLDDERKQKIIRGGCVLSSKSPKYICNSCSYEWGNVFQSKK